MHRQTRLVAATLLLLLAAMGPALTVASASTLNVDGGVLQHWNLPGPQARAPSTDQASASIHR